MRKKPFVTNKEVSAENTPIITLLSDFGVKDPYVASMKGVILSICRKATLVDVTHEIAKFNILQGAYVLATAIPYFPPGAIHVAVVDPGVGGKRKALLVKTERSYLIGPDNGILMLAANQDGIEKVFEIRNPRYMLPKVSSTFHGRDIFCAVAAHLANGISIDDLGSETHEYVKPKFSRPVTTKGTASGEVIHIDDFGNIVTNVTLKDIVELNIEFNSMITVTIGSVTEKMKFCKSYGDVGIGEPVAVMGGTGFLEVSINRGNAASTHNAKEGTRVSISRRHPKKGDIIRKNRVKNYRG